MKCDRCSRAATEGGSRWSDELRCVVTYASCESHAKDVRLKFHGSITLAPQTELPL